MVQVQAVVEHNMRFKDYLLETLEKDALNLDDLEKKTAESNKKKKKKKDGMPVVKDVGWVTDPEGLLKYLQLAKAAQG